MFYIKYSKEYELFFKKKYSDSIYIRLLLKYNVTDLKYEEKTGT